MLLYFFENQLNFYDFVLNGLFNANILSMIINNKGFKLFPLIEVIDISLPLQLKF